VTFHLDPSTSRPYVDLPHPNCLQSPLHVICTTISHHNPKKAAVQTTISNFVKTCQMVHELWQTTDIHIRAPSHEKSTALWSGTWDKMSKQWQFLVSPAGCVSHE
jgi:hypothetical protein